MSTPDFSSRARRDVDNVEADFFRFSQTCDQGFEDIVDVVRVTTYDLPGPLVEQLTESDREALSSHAPWGYGYWIDPVTSTAELDSPDDYLTQQLALDEMALRLSVLDAVWSDLIGQGDRILDLATNCGIIPIHFARRHPIAIRAIDNQQANIDKGRELTRIANIDSVQLELGDVYEVMGESRGEVDVVLALGIFYHLANPIGLLQKIYDSGCHTVVVDTIIHNLPFSGWVQTVSRHVKWENLGHANDTNKIIELHPTVRGLADSLAQVGFEDVVEYRPSDGMLSRFNAPVYQSGNRRFLVGRRG